MNENHPDSGDPGVSAFDTAAYIFDVAGQLASMADAHRFIRLAAALELARGAAAEALASLAVESQSGARKAATEDAA
ncbi:MAG: hypothetical protein K2P58_14635 [Hyphomonadaceae bacterium]|nr:hypothetical protein [Hyphomonadaceae bacterium]